MCGTIRLNPAGKKWLADSAAVLGLNANGLAGLHAHFLVATAMHARPGDIGSFVTSAEWLDVNYGNLLRKLVASQLGGVSIHIVDPAATPFSDAATTAAVTCFEVGTTRASIRVKRVPDAAALGTLDNGRRLNRERLRTAPRWTPLIDGTPKPPDGYVELGELCRVHRGTVTGANKIWITDPSDPRLPSGVLFPAITRARELFDAPDGILSTACDLLAVIDSACRLGRIRTLPIGTGSRGFLRRSAAPRYPRGIHRSPPQPVVVSEAQGAGPNPRDVHGPTASGVRTQTQPDVRHVKRGPWHLSRVRSMTERRLLMRSGGCIACSGSLPRLGEPTLAGLSSSKPSEMARIHIPGPEMLEAVAA